MVTKSECEELEEYVEELEGLIRDVRGELEELYEEMKKWCYDTNFLERFRKIIDELYDYA